MYIHKTYKKPLYDYILSIEKNNQNHYVIKSLPVVDTNKILFGKNMNYINSGI